MRINIYHICSFFFCLVFMLALNTLFINHFSETSYLEKKVAYLQLENERSYLEMELQEVEMLEFKQEVAQVLPQFNDSPKNYQVRQIASVIGSVANPNIKVGMAKILMRNAKSEYSRKNYSLAKKKLNTYIKKYPHSLHLPESYLMLTDMEFTEKNYEKAIQHISHLVSAYPSNEITAHGLFVLGAIMERQERLEDASDLYRTIIDSFDVKQIQKKAKLNLKNIGL